jgi:hypothetical protein
MDFEFQADAPPASYALREISPPTSSALLPHCQTTELCYKTNVLNLESAVDA